MKRDIKFRGMGSGEMFYGNLTCVTGIGPGNGVKPGYYINNSAGAPFAYYVDPDTIGQFTGLKDKNGVEIYEGDIVKASIVTTLDEWEHEELLAVKFLSGGFYAKNNKRGILLSGLCKENPLTYLETCEVIGNIYQNPELLTASGSDTGQ